MEEKIKLKDVLIISLNEETKLIESSQGYDFGLFDVEDIEKLYQYAKNTLAYYKKNKITQDYVDKSREKLLSDYLNKYDRTKRVKPPKEDDLYLVHDTILNTLKIGRSGNPKTRLINLQISTANKLELLHICEKAGFMEHEIHEKFKEFRLASEWFSYQEEIVNYIQNLKIYF